MPAAASLMTFVATCLAVILCVIIHYEGLSAMSRWVAHGVLPPRRRIAMMILGQLLLHIAEIAVFAAAYFLLVSAFDVGVLQWIGGGDTGATPPVLDDFQDYFYFSVVCYTTLGFGDFVPIGALRFMSGLEAVAGLVLITWSASFTFLEMQRYWGRE
jgi:hypothetical protein